MNGALQVDWMRCGEGRQRNWCHLLDLGFNNAVRVPGVYVIWHSGDGPNIVKVGQAANDVSERLGSLRTDADEGVLSYRTVDGTERTLHVTWTVIVDDATRDGVEAFLARG